MKVTKVDVRKKAYGERSSKTKVFFHQTRETVLENFEKRLTGTAPTSRDLRKMLPEVLERMGLPTDAKVSFSKYCGCSSCPCSPGFNIDTWAYGQPPQTVFVDYAA